MAASDVDAVSPSCSPLPESEPQSSLDVTNALLVRLIEALEAQTAAISALAASNEAIVDVLVEQGDGPDPDAEPTHDLAGRPLS